MRLFSTTVMLSLTVILGACETQHGEEAFHEENYHHSDWKLDVDDSGMTYITTTAGALGEINTFREMSGNVTAEGLARVRMNTSSVDTNNVQRDMAMRDVLFQSDLFPYAEARGRIDVASLEALPVGSSETVLFDMELEIAGETISKPFYVLVTRMTEDRVMVTNKAPLILLATDFGLMNKLANISVPENSKDVSPVVPVTMTLVFERD